MRCVKEAIPPRADYSSLFTGKMDKDSWLRIGDQRRLNKYSLPPEKCKGGNPFVKNEGHQTSK
jgi:hypothetical protein